MSSYQGKSSHRGAIRRSDSDFCFDCAISVRKVKHRGSVQGGGSSRQKHRNKDSGE